MEDHVDPVKHDYFDGLHTEIENVENELGLNPSSDYSTVRDRLDAFGVPAPIKIKQIETVKVTSDLNTASATFVDIAGMSITITTGANKLLILASFAGPLKNTPADPIIGGAVSLHDGSNNIAGIEEYAENASNFTYLDVHGSIIILETVSAGEHTYKLQWKRLATNSTIYCNVNAAPEINHCTLTIIELE